MKKIIAFAIGLFSVTAIFAQSRTYNDHYGSYGESRDAVLGRSYDSHDHGFNSNNVYNYPSQRSDYRYNEQGRREEMDHINRDYDDRTDRYRGDYSINPYERGRRIEQPVYERREGLGSFAGGAIVGAVAGVLLGTVLSH